MWINPRTGKGWTDAEESAFADIQRVSRLNRIQAIQLFKRCRSNASKAIKLAKRDYAPRPPKTHAQLAAFARARTTRHKPKQPVR